MAQDPLDPKSFQEDLQAFYDANWREMMELKKPKKEKKMAKAILAIVAAWLFVTSLVAGFIAIIMAVVYSVQAILS